MISTRINLSAEENKGLAVSIIAHLESETDDPSLFFNEHGQLVSYCSPTGTHWMIECDQLLEVDVEEELDLTPVGETMLSIELKESMIAYFDEVCLCRAGCLELKEYVEADIASMFKELCQRAGYIVISLELVLHDIVPVELELEKLA